ncbi:E3 ubiquitin-protein ligase rnf213-alpha isoform X2 [Hydra vulgaris]|uniref:E3 ubiquitin-protein ligase rnf213-alpha isoform X2 n=1 Tax=Hydra vulgaris TaxID=6087 RepID=UPI0032E9EC8B
MGGKKKKNKNISQANTNAIFSHCNECNEFKNRTSCQECGNLSEEKKSREKGSLSIASLSEERSLFRENKISNKKYNSSSKNLTQSISLIQSETKETGQSNGSKKCAVSEDNQMCCTIGDHKKNIELGFDNTHNEQLEHNNFPFGFKNEVDIYGVCDSFSNQFSETLVLKPTDITECANHACENLHNSLKNLNKEDQFIQDKACNVPSGNKVHIKFFVILPEVVKNLFIAFGNDYLGGWNNYRVQMMPFKHYLEGVIYHGDLHIPEQIIEKPIEYKYVAVGKEKTWDVLHFTFPQKSETNRMLIIPTDFKELGMFYQVDDSFMCQDCNSASGFAFLGKALKKILNFYNGSQHCFLKLFKLYVLLLQDYPVNTVERIVFICGLYFGFYKAYRSFNKNIVLWVKLDQTHPFKELLFILEKEIKKKSSGDLKVITSTLSLLVIFYKNTDLIYLTDISFFCCLFKKLSLENIGLDCDSLLRKLKEQFPTKYLSMIKMALESILFHWFSKSDDISSNMIHVWCYAIVILHIISEEKKDKIMLEDFNVYNCGLPVYINVIKEKIILETIANVKKVRNSLKKDVLLSRGLVYLMDLQSFSTALRSGYFKENLLINMMTFRLSSKKNFEDLNGCTTFLNVLMSNKHQKEKKRCQVVNDLFIMFLKALENVTITEKSCHFFSLILKCIKVYNETLNQNGIFFANLHNEISKTLSAIKLILSDIVLNWELKPESSSAQIEFLQVLLQFETNGQKEFHDLALDVLPRKLEQTEKIILFKICCEVDIFQYGNEIVMEFDRIFFSTVDSLLNEVDFLSLLSSKPSNYCTKLLTKFFLNKWCNLHNKEDKVNFCLDWKPVKIFLKILKNVLDDDAVLAISDCKSVIQGFCKNIKDGDFSISFFLTIIMKEEAIFELISLIFDICVCKNFIFYFKIRKMQVKAFLLIYNTVDYTLQMCIQTLLDIDKAFLEGRLQLSNILLKEVFGKSFNEEELTKEINNRKSEDCELEIGIQHYKYEKSLFKLFALIACHFFSISYFWFNHTLRIMEFKLANNFLFCMEIQLIAKELQVSKLKVHSDGLIKLIFLPLNKKLTALMESILSCKISLSELNTLFPDYKVQEHVEELKYISEYLNLNFSRHDFDRSLAKIKTIFLMQEYSEYASVALRVKLQYNLNGDFSALEYIVRPLNEFAELEDLISCEKNELLFQKLTPTIIEIFKSISLCMHFFDWVKNNLRDPKEVKVFVEIMSIAAGETDYDLDRVKCFEASCLVFNNVIFDLDNNSGFKELLNVCQQIERKMKSDPNILIKLIDTNNNLEWFKNAKKSQGSVATKTIMEAQIANRNGCFVIGNYGNNNGDFIVNKLSDVIKFEIVNSTPKAYTLEEVNDLQSRLMLLGGDIGGNSLVEKQKERDYFIEIVEVIMRLGQAYMMLCKAGDVSYINWRKNFFCSIESGEEFLLADLKLETVKIEKRLTEWSNMLKNIRLENPIINHFTIKQCLFLQKHLYFLYEDSNYCQVLPFQFYILLKKFNQDVKLTNVKKALSLSNRKKNQIVKDDWKKTSNFDELTALEIHKIVSSLHEVFKFSETVAWAATLNIFPYCEWKAVLWCNKQKQDDDQMIEFELEARKRYEQLLKINTCNEVLVENNTYVSVEELSSFLKEYIDLKIFQVKRSIPNYIHKNKPTLIVLPHDEVLYAVLDIYLHENGAFPSSEEVLLCDNTVSVEEIELLILRAHHYKDSLFCLVIDDNLQYESCEKAYKFLEATIKLGIMSPLVVFCNSERQNESYFVTALEHYKLKIPISIQKQNTIKDVHSCLERKLINKTTGIHLNTSIYKTLVVQSTKSGMGKTLCVKKCGDHLDLFYKGFSMAVKNTFMVTIPVHGTTVNVNSIVEALLEYDQVSHLFSTLYHFDINPMVKEGLDSFLFNLVILGSLKTSTGKLWKIDDKDTCIIEITIDNSERQANNESNKSTEVNYGVVNMLPNVTCLSPCEVLSLLSDQTTSIKDASESIWYDSEEYKKNCYQRVCQYLSIYSGKTRFDVHYGNHITKIYIHTLDKFVYDNSQIIITQKDCLQILLKYCGVNNPCWSEIRNFVHFFNSQLIDCENSVFTSDLCSTDLRGFKHFVVGFLLEMSQDFSTCSVSSKTVDNNCLMVQLKRKWEHSLHPYLFFNQDHATMTFFEFNIDQSGNLFDPETGSVIKKNIMSTELYHDINRQMEGCLNTKYKLLNRNQKLEILCRVLGVQTFDPDPTYELTVDNLKKILAIHMRLRCAIPVIMMGETGCGKTKLIKFMCGLRAGNPKIRNMFLVKVHGGVTHQDILIRIKQAKCLAKENYENYKINTILFFDEANTSDAIGLIKEIMVDKRADGKPLGLEECGLEIIAACNPYRRHTPTMIQKLESAGLGYNVKSPYEKIGDIPLRQLVYRVHPLPKSMIPLIWDFGQLKPETEETYARQLIKCYIKEKALPDEPMFFDLLVKVLSESQVYMRKQQDECHFVSLRDVERVLMATSWFYKKNEILMQNMDISNTNSNLSEPSEYEKMCLSLIYALHVCYIAKLEDRDLYRKHISKYITAPGFACDANRIKEEVHRLQKSFLNGIDLEENIAQNQALCENIFMMVICVELRIPLFVVGKPGSSKSLAKSIVQDCMQGKMSKSFLYKKFKQIFMLSYQCSPLSTAERIINTFRQCSRFQVEKDLDTFASVVVLDEVGLAEDSPKMPLKALHSLLEDGTDGSEDLTADGSTLKDKRVAFIGISNWSLDPAKMNRGIMLYRGQPDVNELVLTARDICSGDKAVRRKIDMLFEPLTKGYYMVYEEQKKSDVLISCKKEEYFGLRDFYSLIKLVFCYARKLQDVPSISDIKYAVQRNFSGLQEINSWKIFKSFLPQNLSKTERTFDVLSMITDSIADQCPCYVVRGENAKRHCLSSRYLLLMTEDFSALPIIDNLYEKEKFKSCIIFGSSFPKDQQFTQVCRDINRIKICMETGTKVVLLNMENLYESLYDALNQYYVSLGGNNYVDLGIGTHRVKCRVHEDFRLIVIADRANVYSTFPIPLINRLEKHFLTLANGMPPDQLKVVEKLKEWATHFSCVKSTTYEFKPKDSFIGYTEDTCASIVLKLSQTHCDPDKIFEEGCKLLLKLATPDSLLRVMKSSLQNQFGYIENLFYEQFHSSLISFLYAELGNTDSKFLQITTFSKLLSLYQKESLSAKLTGFKIEMASLLLFETEQSFREFIRVSFNSANNSSTNARTLIIIQVNNAQENKKLIACAQYICKEMRDQFKGKKISVLFILQLNYKSSCFNLLSSVSFWDSFHIDELCSSSMPSFIKQTGKSLHDIFCNVNDEEKLKLIELITGCIQMATRQISERKKMNINEVSKRIDKITELLKSHPKDMKYLFVTTIMQMIQNNLKKEEHNMLPDFINNWVHYEAIEQKYIKDYGTFQQALRYYVQDRIVPILSSIMSNIDCFSNLSILFKQPDYTDLWLKLFSKTNCSSIQISNELEESFQCKFPFSNRLFKEIELVIKNVIQPEHNFNKHDYKLIYDTLSSMPMTSLTLKLSKSNVDDYIYDLVHLLFPHQTEKSYKVLAHGLVFFVRNIVTARSSFFSSSKVFDDLDKSSYDIIALHVVLNTRITQERIGNVELILRSYPEISDMISLTSPIDIDILILEHLVSIVDCLEMSPFCMNKIKSLNVLVQRILDINLECFGSLTIKKINELRVKWCKLRICERFSEFVFFPSTCFCSHQTNLLHLLKKRLDMLKDDMLTQDSWALIENFLKVDATNFSSNFNQQSIYRDFINCLNCTGDGKDIGIFLPCCKSSFNLCIHHILFKTTKCPVCSKVFEKDDIFENSLQKRHIVFGKKEFKKRCDAFYAEVITEFYFAKRNFNMVEADVSNKVLDFVFFAPATSSLDLNSSDAESKSIVCLYLLQQLFHRSYNDVESYLQKHFQKLFFNENKKQLFSTATLFIYCSEDKLQLEHSLIKKNSVINAPFLDAVSEGLIGIYDLKEKFTSDISNSNSKFFEAVASARLFLGYSADILYLWFAKKNTDVQLKKKFNSFFETLGSFLIKYKNTPMHIYILKQIVRKYGIDSLKNILAQANADWLIFKKKSNNIQSYDKLLMHGDNYKNLYNRLVANVLENDQHGLSQLVKDIENSNLHQMLWLTIPKVVHNLDKFHTKIVKKVQHRLQIQECCSVLNKFKPYEQFTDILYHFWVVVNSGKPVTQLFSLLMIQPLKVKCGRPWIEVKCPTCFLTIGGKNHILAAKNQEVSNRNDSTKPGHCLGFSSDRSAFSIPQRTLTPASATLQTFLINLSLFVSTLLGNEKEVCELVHPRVSALQLKTFFLAHLEKDFVLLSNIIAKTDDEINTVIHLLFKWLLDCNLQDKLFELKDQASRNQYENTFHQTVVQPFFCTLNDQLESYNKCLLTDQCITNSPLMRHIYEIDDKHVSKDSSMTLMSPHLWLYRESVSVESLKNFVQHKVATGAAKDIPILVMIFEQELILTMIKDLSSILELQRFLQYEFNYKLDKQTAVEKNVKEVLREFPKKIRATLQKLFVCFIKTWNESRTHFTARQMKLDHNLHSIKLDLNSKLAYFISSNSDHGLCAAMLIDFLASKQNELLLECQLNNSINVFQRLHITHLKENNIIFYERDRDLLPLVYKHCEYSLDMGRSPKIEYNLDTIQKRLLENVIFGKSIIDIEVIQFLFRDGLKSLNFPLLRSNVKQTSIPLSEQHNILKEFNDITDISKTLRAVETAIGILASTGGDPNMLYKKYLLDILRMDECEYLANKKMQNFIRLTHLHSVWLLLTTERARYIYTSKQQVPFQIKEFFMAEDLDDKILKDQKIKFSQANIIELLSLVTEYVVLELPLRKESDCTMMLMEALQIYDNQLSCIDRINEEFLLKHIYLFWTMIVSLV